MKKLAAFDVLQITLSQPMTLIYHNPNKALQIDFDTSKEFSFDVVAFYTAEDVLYKAKWSSSTSMQTILFLSRLLIAAKNNYQSIELEIAGFVWIIKKLRYLVESSHFSIIIQTHYLAILDIMQQLLIISINFIIRMNIHLVRAS